MMHPAHRTGLPPPPYVLTGGKVLRHAAARPQRLDIAVDADGRIREVAPHIAVAAGAAVVDLAGRLVVPGLVDCHQHLDKCLTRDKVPNPAGDLPGAVAAYADFAAGVTREDIIARARAGIERSLRRGTVAIRTHTNVDPHMRARGVEALVALREELRRHITLQVVAFVTAGATKRDADAARWLEDAIAAGADVVGGTPAIADEPEAFLDMLFDAAERHALPLDLHLDEHLDGERHFFAAVIERTRARGMQGRVTVGHCSALSATAPDRARAIIDGFREAGIKVITLPAANLFLQGRQADRLQPRGLTRVRELIAAGVPVAAATDNMEDPFIPVGTGDLLEIARWTLLAGGLSSNDLPLVFAMVTTVAAEVMGLGADYGIRPGARADLLISDCADIEDLVARGPAERCVLVAGRPVAGAVALGA